MIKCHDTSTNGLTLSAGGPCVLDTIIFETSPSDERRLIWKTLKTGDLQIEAATAQLLRLDIADRVAARKLSGTELSCAAGLLPMASTPSSPETLPSKGEPKPAREDLTPPSSPPCPPALKGLVLQLRAGEIAG